MRWGCLLLLAITLSACSDAGGTVTQEGFHTHWQAYAKKFIQADGRVVEYSQGNRTTSEAQAYALFFALLDNDREHFEHILRWTEDNLAKGDLSKNLPAWLWGEGKDKSWKVLDSNPASDADLWLAYTLIQAGKLWHEPHFLNIGDAVLEQIEMQEIGVLDSVGAVLLPTLKSTLEHDKIWRINLSYMPIQLLRFFASYMGHDVWNQTIKSVLYLTKMHHVNGVVPDWIIYDRDQKRTYVRQDAAMSYDAIRVYLWAGMLSKSDVSQSELIALLKGITKHFRYGWSLPSKIYLTAKKKNHLKPLGFSAAILPLLRAINRSKLYHFQIKRVNLAMRDCLLGKPPLYYDNNLMLFVDAWLEHVLRFEKAGGVRVSW